MMIDELAVLVRKNTQVLVTKAGMSHMQFSKAIGISASTVGNLLGRDHPMGAPSQKTIKIIEKYFQLPSGSLVKRNCNKPDPPGVEAARLPMVINTIDVSFTGFASDVTLKVSEERALKMIKTAMEA